MTDQLGPPTPGPSGPDRWWRIFGIILTAIFVIGGLAVVAFVIFFVVAINSYGSNK